MTDENRPTTFGQFDVVAYDWIDQEENPLIKLVEDEDDMKLLEIVVGGGVIMLWPAEEIAKQIVELVFPEPPATPTT